MKEKIYIVLFIAFVLFPLFIFGNSIEDAKMLDFQQGDGTFETWFMKSFATLDTFIEQRAIEASLLGKAIGGFGMMIYLAVLGYRMQSGDAEWSIVPMLKPIIIGLIIINWVPFTKLIQVPLQKLAEPSITYFDNIESEADDLRLKRWSKQKQVAEATKQLEVRIKQQMREIQAQERDLIDAIGDKFSDLMSPIAEFAEDLNYRLQLGFGKLVELICLMILRVSVYFIFFIQKIWSYVLIVLGPFAVGMAMIPGFENSFYNWVSKFININLYTFVAYTIINIGQQLIMMGFKMDIERLSKIVDDSGNANIALLHAYSASDGMLGAFLFPCVGYLISAVGVMMTPTIADTIVTAGGAGVMTKAKAAASKITSTSGAIGKTVISKATGGLSRITKK